MGISESSNLAANIHSMPDSLFCSIRKYWVADLPEERIRQALILNMTQELGYPLNWMALEKSLDQLPHIQPHPSLPKRRADLIVFAQHIHPQHALYPLLLIECKATPLNAKVLRQLIGYNHFIQAPFIAAVNANDLHFGFYHQKVKDFQFEKQLPHYSELIQFIARSNKKITKI